MIWCMIRICIVIPAHNEQSRIEKTLTTYATFFTQKAAHGGQYIVDLLVVLNGCTDNTRHIVEKSANRFRCIRLYEINKTGKGISVRFGFNLALQASYDLIGFVDADMATMPEQFYTLIESIDNADGVIASRYMPGAQTYPDRPWIKRWGSKLFYETLVAVLFNIRYYDYQCGAKLFKRSAIEIVIAHLTVDQWVFDVELLYWCSYFKLMVKEIPTVWHDRSGSKLTIFGSGLPMLWELLKLKWQLFTKD